jgi:hypothetical protein
MDSTCNGIEHPEEEVQVDLLLLSASVVSREGRQAQQSLHMSLTSTPLALSSVCVVSTYRGGATSFIFTGHSSVLASWVCVWGGGDTQGGE